MYLQLSLSQHFCLVYLLSKSCDGNNAKYNAFSSVDVGGGRLNARVMEMVGNAFYGGLEYAGNGNSV